MGCGPKPVLIVLTTEQCGALQRLVRRRGASQAKVMRAGAARSTAAASHYGQPARTPGGAVRVGLKTELVRRWSTTGLLDLFKEAELRIGVTDAFGGAAKRPTATMCGAGCCRRPADRVARRVCHRPARRPGGGRAARGARRAPGARLRLMPVLRATGTGVALVAKCPDAADAEAAIVEVTALITTTRLAPIQGEPPIEATGFA